jgi:YidC/Oxa1 family membrane protein insertase
LIIKQFRQIIFILNHYHDQKSYNASSKPESVVLRLSAGDDKYIEYTYSLAPDKYTVDFNVTFKSLESVIASNQNSLTLDWKMYCTSTGKGSSE